MTRYLKYAASFLFVPVLLCACINLKKPQNRIEYYTLEYDRPAMAGLAPLSSVLRIERFGVAPSYNSSRIIYRDRTFKRDAYAYHRWHANPGNLVTCFLARDMREAAIFRAVLPHDSGFPATHIVAGSVDEFLEWDGDEQWKALLVISITLMAENEPDIAKKIVFQQRYRTEKLCGSKNPRSLAEAMSRAIAELSEKIILDIHGRLKGERQLR